MDFPQKSTFYRVTGKALIFDDQNRLLVICNAKGHWELPGGGWEYDESFEECLRREIDEELGVNVSEIGAVRFMYRRMHNEAGVSAVRIATDVTLNSYDFAIGDDMREVRFVSRATFLRLDFTHAEGDVADHVDEIWP